MNQILVYDKAQNIHENFITIVMRFSSFLSSHFLSYDDVFCEESIGNNRKKYPFELIKKIRSVPERRVEPCKQDMGSLIYRSRHLHSALNHTLCGFDLVYILIIVLFFPEPYIINNIDYSLIVIIFPQYTI